jgi:hypothetical protein
VFGMMVQVEGRPAPPRRLAGHGLVERLSHIARQAAQIGVGRGQAKPCCQASHARINRQDGAVGREEQQA